LDFLGTALWTLGLLIESIADLQLTRFKSNRDNQGKLLTTGLWRFSRHPNYFGEAVIWWGYYLIAIAAGYAWTIFSPIVMTYLLLQVSGVAMLERTMKLKPGYDEYIKKTSAFILWFPKR
jgi:steroid 5-alpha reductase family enzyme